MAGRSRARIYGPLGLAAGALAIAGWLRAGAPPPAAPAPPPAAVDASPRIGRAAAAADRPASLAGALTDDRGAPIAIGRVCAARAGAGGVDPIGACVAARAGRWRIEALAPGAYVVLGAAAGHVPAPYRGVRLAPLAEAPLAALPLAAGDALTDVDLALSRGGAALRGRVRDAGGPVAGVRVGWLRHGPRYDLHARALTGDDGRFALDVAPGTVLIEAAFEGYVRRTLEVAAPGPEIEILLAPGGAIAGRTIDRATGGPVGGVAVTARPLAAAALGWGGLDVATSAADGGFALEGLRAGPYALHARGPGWSGDVARVDVALDAPTAVDVDLARGARIAGAVVERAGAAACPGGRLALRSLPAAGATGAARLDDAPIDRDGRFALPCAAPGRYAIDLACDGWLPPPDPPILEIGRDDQLGVRVVLDAGVALRGVVVAAGGAPVAGVAIEIEPHAGPGAGPGDGGRTARTTTAGDGGFALHGLEPGRWSIAARTRDGDDLAEPVALEVGRAPPAPLRLILRPSGAASIRLTDRAGATVGDVRVVLQGERVGAREAGFDGRAFRVRDLPPGDYAIGVVGGRGEDLTPRPPPRLAIAIDREATAEVSIERPRGRLAGLVVEADGRPAADVVVTASVEVGDGGGAAGALDLGGTITDERGRFVLHGIGPGTFAVTATHGDGRVAHRAGATPGRAVRLMLGP